MFQSHTKHTEKENPQILDPQNVNFLRIHVPPYCILRFRGFISFPTLGPQGFRKCRLFEDFFSVCFVCQSTVLTVYSAHVNAGLSLASGSLAAKRARGLLFLYPLAHRISIKQEMDFGFFTVFRFLLELEILFLIQDFGLEQDLGPEILLETEILLEEQDFELNQETKNGEKTETHFLLDRNPV